MLNNLWFPQNLALDLFRHTFQLVAKALDEHPTGQNVEEAMYALLSSPPLTGNWDLDQRLPRVVAVVGLGHLRSHALISFGWAWCWCQWQKDGLGRCTLRL